MTLKERLEVFADKILEQEFSQGAPIFNNNSRDFSPLFDNLSKIIGGTTPLQQELSKVASARRSEDPDKGYKDRDTNLKQRSIEINEKLNDQTLDAEIRKSLEKERDEVKKSISENERDIAIRNAIKASGYNENANAVAGVSEDNAANVAVEYAGKSGRTKNMLANALLNKSKGNAAGAWMYEDAANHGDEDLGRYEKFQAKMSGVTSGLSDWLHGKHHNKMEIGQARSLVSATDSNKVSDPNNSELEQGSKMFESAIQKLQDIQKDLINNPSKAGEYRNQGYTSESLNDAIKALQDKRDKFKSTASTNFEGVKMFSENKDFASIISDIMAGGGFSNEGLKNLSKNKELSNKVAALTAGFVGGDKAAKKASKILTKGFRTGLTKSMKKQKKAIEEYESGRDKDIAEANRYADIVEKDIDTELDKDKDYKKSIADLETNWRNTHASNTPTNDESKEYNKQLLDLAHKHGYNPTKTLNDTAEWNTFITSGKGSKSKFQNAWRNLGASTDEYIKNKAWNEYKNSDEYKTEFNKLRDNAITKNTEAQKLLAKSKGLRSLGGQGYFLNLPSDVDDFVFNKYDPDDINSAARYFLPLNTGHDVNSFMKNYNNPYSKSKLYIRNAREYLKNNYGVNDNMTSRTNFRTEHMLDNLLRSVGRKGGLGMIPHLFRDKSAKEVIRGRVKDFTQFQSSSGELIGLSDSINRKYGERSAIEDKISKITGIPSNKLKKYSLDELKEIIMNFSEYNTSSEDFTWHPIRAIEDWFNKRKGVKSFNTATGIVDAINEDISKSKSNKKYFNKTAKAYANYLKYAGVPGSDFLTEEANKEKQSIQKAKSDKKDLKSTLNQGMRTIVRGERAKYGLGKKTDDMISNLKPTLDNPDTLDRENKILGNYVIENGKIDTNIQGSKDNINVKAKDIGTKYKVEDIDEKVKDYDWEFFSECNKKINSILNYDFSRKDFAMIQGQYDPHNASSPTTRKYIDEYLSEGRLTPEIAINMIATNHAVKAGKFKSIGYDTDKYSQQHYNLNDLPKPYKRAARDEFIGRINAKESYYGPNSKLDEFIDKFNKKHDLSEDQHPEGCSCPECCGGSESKDFKSAPYDERAVNMILNANFTPINVDSDKVDNILSTNYYTTPKNSLDYYSTDMNNFSSKESDSLDYLLNDSIL